MYERLRHVLVGMFEADSAAVTDFYASADRYRQAFEAMRIGTSTPWPFGLLEWSPPETAPPPVRHVIEVVHHNTAHLQRIVTRYGWPGRALVGEDGADAAWLVLQHASSGVPTLGTPANLAFCRSCVPLLERAVAAGEAHPRHLAATVDSLRLAEGLPPMFAVLALDYQVVDGQPIFRCPVDATVINEQRIRIGLPLLASDVSRRALGERLDPAGPGRAEPWPLRAAPAGADPIDLPYEA
jgi:hypothetical protein